MPVPFYRPLNILYYLDNISDDDFMFHCQIFPETVGLKKKSCVEHKETRNTVEAESQT